MGRVAGPPPRFLWEPPHRFLRWHVNRRVTLQVDGIENVPETGPVMLASRHFHHFWDGAIFAATIPRPIHIVVGLDWAHGHGRRAMAMLCRAAGWPMILRTDGNGAAPGADDARDARRYLRQATDETVALLRAGELVIVFPEGFPTIDPHESRKPDRDAFLPFQAGFAHFVAQAQRDGRTHVPIVPVGFAYEPLNPRETRWRVFVRFGVSIVLRPGQDRDALVREVEGRVKALSWLRP
jgi:1-acyl-sn-glycerol-3-phosphate acyltransferase